MHRRSLIGLACLIFIPFMSFGQKYNTVGGIRFGEDLGITFAQRIANKTTAELLIQPGTLYRNTFTSLSVKQHYGLLSKRFNFFMGGGVFIGNAKTSETTFSNAGMTFPMGAEVTFGQLNVSFDYLPMALIKRDESQSWFASTSGISLRYVFWKRESSMRKFFKGLGEKFRRKKS
ncbi:MAG: hypothetical protein R2774_05155 [Saprospiraceae bacterium]